MSTFHICLTLLFFFWFWENSFLRLTGGMVSNSLNNNYYLKNLLCCFLRKENKLKLRGKGTCGGLVTGLHWSTGSGVAEILAPGI